MGDITIMLRVSTVISEYSDPCASYKEEWVHSNTVYQFSIFGIFYSIYWTFRHPWDFAHETYWIWLILWVVSWSCKSLAHVYFYLSEICNTYIDSWYIMLTTHYNKILLSYVWMGSPSSSKDWSSYFDLVDRHRKVDKSDHCVWIDRDGILIIQIGTSATSADALIQMWWLKLIWFSWHQWVNKIEVALYIRWIKTSWTLLILV